MGVAEKSLPVNRRGEGKGKAAWAAGGAPGRGRLGETSLSGNSVSKKVVNFHGESVIPGADSSGVGQVEQSRLI